MDSDNSNDTALASNSRIRRYFKKKKMEKAPLLSQKRLFRSLSGTTADDNVTDTLSEENYDANRTLGTFSGVFAPVALSQFSSLLFLRIGFIVGSLGFLTSFGTLTLVYVILLFTVLSICAISTNGAVEGGGPYYMISRTLGPEFGGAIGALFFMANVFSSALYITGCVEGIIHYFGLEAGSLAIYRFLPEGTWYNFGYGCVLNIFCVFVCLIGAGMFAKTTVFILVIVLGCTAVVFISFLALQHTIQVPIPATNERFVNFTGNYTGLSLATLRENLYPLFALDYTTGNRVEFATVFSVLLSGVTGIMAGANLSGELKNPSRSIPFGTLLSCAFTFVIYLVLFFLTAASCSRFLLQNNYNYMMGIFWVPSIAIGVFTSTFSASLSCLIGASRVLAALVKDDIYGPFTRWLSSAPLSLNPVRCILFSGVMVQAVLLIGKLNTIALFASVFFLLSYLATNIACLCLEWASAPNFRPTFPYFAWWTAILGIIANGVMMFVVSSIASAICIILCLVMIIILHLSPSNHKWGSISQALIFHQVRKYLLLLDSRKDHVKFWRPQILLLVANPRSACPLIDFVNDLKKSGLYILGHVMVEKENENSVDLVASDYPKWQCLVDYLKIKAFVEVNMDATVRSGMRQLVRIAGIGAMKPNTIILGFRDDAAPQDFFTSTSPFCLLEESGNYRSRSGATPSPNGGTISSYLLEWQMENRRVQSRLSSIEYVGMIQDILKMDKNVCLCRHFHLLDKTGILKKSNGDYPYIDVWPINFFAPDERTVFDTSSLYLMQLATILNMVSTWRKRTRLRVFLCVSDATADPDKQRTQVWRTLRELRMVANVVVVQWSHVTHAFKVSNGTQKFDKKQFPVNFSDPEDEIPIYSIGGYQNSSPERQTPANLSYPDHIKLSIPDQSSIPNNNFGSQKLQSSKLGFESQRESSTEGSSSTSTKTEIAIPNVEYLNAVNQMVRENSVNTAVSFMYLPSPPLSTGLFEEYLDALTILTEHLHPTLLVHGVSTVTTTNL